MLISSISLKKKKKKKKRRNINIPETLCKIKYNNEQAITIHKLQIKSQKLQR